eukprot:TRINITY_DN714_c0_g1_i2.p1 TRINITY_DN714_c0_g1~~TRINITY_DN714_c0_g1_i2.p1  ORF type:complete len:163 (+),score=66.89 TRINITY_DN714_c0_g1_i2:52-489(+)
MVQEKQSIFAQNPFLTAVTAGGVSGALLSSVAIAWRREAEIVKRTNSGAKIAESMRNVGMNAAFYAAVAGAFVAGKELSHAARNRDDWINTLWGSVTAGAVVGLRAQKVSVGIGASAAFMTVLTLTEIAKATQEEREKRRSLIQE